MPPRMLNEDEEEGDGIEVTWDDQSRINSFSKLNTRLADIEDDLKARLEEKESLEDLSMELELADEDEPVLYKLGDAFFHLPLKQAQKMLEKDQANLEERISKLSARKAECVDGMGELKIQLYSKFGKQINLETDPED